MKNINNLILALLLIISLSCAGKKVTYLPDTRQIIDTDDFSYITRDDNDKYCFPSESFHFLLGRYCFDKGYWDHEVADALEQCRAILKAKKEGK